MLYDIQTRKQTELFDQRTTSLDWSPDGKFVFVCSRDSGFWRIRVSDRKAEPIRGLKRVLPIEWGWLTITPNDSLVTARSTGTGEIYALDWELP